MRAYQKQTFENTIKYIIKGYNNIAKKDITITTLCHILLAFDFEYICNMGMPTIEAVKEIKIDTIKECLTFKNCPKFIKISNKGIVSMEDTEVETIYFSDFELDILENVLLGYIRNGLNNKQENYIMYNLNNISAS